MGHETEKLSFFRRLAKDVTANTVVISAAALVPLMAMVGGGVDASRYYMTSTRLQAACDAGALAARRAMDDDDFTGEHKQIGRNFFDQNFEDGQFGLEELARDYSATQDGEVVGAATGTLPSVIMDAFGYDEFELDVSCTADINISNTDIMFVLDVTGSMNCPATDTGCSNNGNVEAADSKMSNLRDSVLTFYDSVEAATSNNAQVRYGIMPYSNQVNVGDSLSSAWMAQRHTYQSREADWEVTTSSEPTYGYVTSGTEYRRTGGAYGWDNQNQEKLFRYYVSNYDQCAAKTSTMYDIYHDSNEANWVQTSQYGVDPRVTEYRAPVQYEYYSFSRGTYYNGGRCDLYFDYYLYWGDSVITVTETREQTGTEEEEELEFYWAYRDVEFDLSEVYSTGSLVAPTGWEEANETHVWNGCIEEADTVATASWNPVPTSAYDLDIDLVPATEAERWKPMLPSLVYPRYEDGTTNVYNTSYWTRSEVRTKVDKNQPTTYCPKAARKLEEFDSRSELQSWISAANGFVARGATYHDFGMIWGARFISPDGIFSSENATAPNGDAISRHIVFMTDGTQATNNYIYGLYGVEWWDRRVTTDGSQSQMADRHASRFQAACKAARNKNISVWVVAFGTDLSQNLIDCATPGRAYQASDADALDEAFREIAEKISALRLTD